MADIGEYSEVDTGVFNVVEAATKSALDSLQKSVDSLRSRNTRFVTAPRARDLLLVEDDYSMVKAFGRELDRLKVNCALRVVGSVTAARQALAEDYYGVVVLDQKLPDGAGIDVVDSVPRTTHLILFSGQVESTLLAGIGKRIGASVFEKSGDTLREMVAEIELAFQGKV